MKHHCQLSTLLILVCRVIVELHARRFAPRVNGAPQVSKSTHPRKFGNHMTVHRPSERATARPHHRATNVYSPTFQLIWEPKRKLIAHQIYFLTANRKKTLRRIFNSYKFDCRKKTLSDFFASRSSSSKKANTGRPAF